MNAYLLIEWKTKTASGYTLVEGDDLDEEIRLWGDGRGLVNVSTLFAYSEYTYDDVANLVEQHFDDAAEARRVWADRYPDCAALGHAPEPGSFCANCRPAWAGGAL
jgi:hypothetical protein